MRRENDKELLASDASVFAEVAHEVRGNASGATAAQVLDAHERRVHPR